MSPRSGIPAVQSSRSHYFITFSRGESMRCLAVPPWALYSLACFAPLAVFACLGAGAYFFFRDDMLAGLVSRQNRMQYAYEDRLAAMRTELDRVTGRQLLDQNTLEGRVHELLSRQAQIENRAAMLQSLTRQSGVDADATASIPAAPAAGTDKNAGGRATDARGALARVFGNSGGAQRVAPPAPALPANASAFAPAEPAPNLEKPRPEGPEMRGDNGPAAGGAMALLADSRAPVDERLGALAASLQSVEAAHTRAVEAVGARARAAAGRLRAGLRAAGVPLAKTAAQPGAGKDVGGPFVPLKVDPAGSPFEREVFRLQNDFADAAMLRGVARHSPVRQPLNGPLVVTSPFGARVDPFFGRMATHTGVDLRETTGAAIHATAAGKVTTAGWKGGYGNMVEIDHGNGMSTRYGHMSSIAVEVGQSVEARDVIGRVGSTGRSTGSHLHYEVRVDGEPVDPTRFLNAGSLLAISD
jgi:murein DD-endopeptidase MepM/ murein hydrolase activator NlpD